MILFSDNSITARHGFPVAGLPVSCTPTTFPAFCRLCAVLRPAGGIFASMSSRAGKRQKHKTAVKAICRPVTAFYTLMAIPIFPHPKTPHRDRQRPAQGVNQPRPAPLWSKPGYFHLFRAMDSTAQRSFSASHQAQRDPLHKGGLRAIRGGHPFAISISARISA